MAREPKYILEKWMRKSGVLEKEMAGRKLKLWKNFGSVQYIISNVPIFRQVCPRCGELKDTHQELIDDVALRWRMRTDEANRKDAQIALANKIWKEKYEKDFQD
jgi:hypothetical protein